MPLGAKSPHLGLFRHTSLGFLLEDGGAYLGHPRIGAHNLDNHTHPTHIYTDNYIMYVYIYTHMSVADTHLYVCIGL